MSADFTSEVVRLAAVSEPREQPTIHDWHALETDFGVKFAEDYKTLVSSLGSGHFGSGLALQNPRSSSKYTRLSREALSMRREWTRNLEEKLSIRFFPHPGGMVRIGGIDRQDFLLGLDSSGKHLNELFWLDIDSDEIHWLGCSISRFIHDLYLGLLDASWAEGLRDYFWRGGSEPFFTSAAGHNPS